MGNQRAFDRIHNQHAVLAAREECKGGLLDNMISSVEFYSEKSVSDFEDMNNNGDPIKKNLYDALCWPKNQCKLKFII